jgi:hypothetical protein
MSYEAETHEAEHEQFLFEHFLGEHEHEHEHEQFLGEHEQFLGEHEHEHEQHEHELAHEGALTEAEVHELASRFLELESEAELDRFLPFLLPVAKLAISGLGKLAAKGVGKMAAKGVGKLVKSVGRKALQQIRRRPGRRPFRTRQSTSACNCPQQEHEQFLGNIIGGLFGGGGEVELEGHEAEAEFAAAKKFVRFGNAALCRSLAASRRLPPAAAARTAIVSAARTHAPGLLRRGHRCRSCGSPLARRPGATPAAARRPVPVAGRPAGTPIATTTNGVIRGSQGRWVRRGAGIVLTGC